MESEILMMRRLLAMLQENEAQSQASRTAGGYNSGTQGLLTNSRPGGQNFSDLNHGSGAFAGNRYSNPVYHNGYGVNFVHNSDYTQGNGNGCIVKNNSPVRYNRNSYY